MKLHEIKRYHPDDHNAPDNPVVVTVSVDSSLGDEIDVSIDYYAGVGHAGSWDEPPDPGDLEIKKIVLAKDVEEMNDDGDVIKTWKKGTNVDDLPGWTSKTEKKAFDELDKYLSKY